MTALQEILRALPWMLATAGLAWGVATFRRNAGLVDIFWSLFILVAAVYYFLGQPVHTARAVLVVALTTMWALRLAGYLALRNWNAPEDHRYQAIRARNQPGFVWKSLYLVFGLQAALALVVATPLYAGITAAKPLAPLDVVGAVMVLAGTVTESIADAQLALFRADGAHRGRVMDRGLWRYSRHPNYFGEFCVWWGFFLIALSTGAWWTIISPLLMSVLLLRISGVALLERDIGKRRAGYADYVARTNAFFPGRPKRMQVKSNMSRRKSLANALLSPALAVLAACQSIGHPPMPVVDKVDLPRFMGDWYVIANIPTFIERDAHNAVESYALSPDGSIATTFTFRDGSFDGKRKQYHPRGFVLNRQSNALWGMRFIWPFKADYRITYINADYTQTVVSRQKRDYVWIMARTPVIPPGDYERLLRLVEQQGYDIAKVQRVPQHWPE